MSAFRVCDGVKWEVSNGKTGISRFSESALDDPRHSFLFNIVRAACIDDLVDMLGATIVDGTFGQVRQVADAPHLVAKLHSEPFTNTALNVYLETGLGRVEGDLELVTPQYIGHIQAFRTLDKATGYNALTLMSRVEGTNLSSFIGPDEDFYESSERREMIRISAEAVRSVGVNPDIAYWPDVHEDNLIVATEVQTLNEAYQNPIALIDIPTRAWADSVGLSQ